MSDIEQLFDPLIALLRAEFGDELLGVLATGSRIHGTPGPTSDLDVHVVIAQPRRQRRNIVLAGAEIEMFINPAFRVPLYFQDRHPGTIHMFAFGRAIYDPRDVVAQLQDHARVLWQAGPVPYQQAELWMPRYFAADMLRDLIDLGEDEAAAGLQIARLVDQLIEVHCRLQGRWPGKPKRRLAELADWAPVAAQLARAALAGGPLAERRAAVERLTEHVLGPIGGPMPLEWQTEWEPLMPPVAADEGRTPKDEM
ncbi:MAG TPA: hypothetical protein VFU22_34200 [Roseiflexaceae bacterium]|nr:hypothetical protein [Roseiflexaceae bacterium]